MVTWAGMGRRLSWASPGIVGLLIVSTCGSVVIGADTNLMTHCDVTGVHCVPDCDPATGFVATTEDDPCWLIQSSSSDWRAPWFAVGVKDYRP